MFRSIFLIIAVPLLLHSQSDVQILNKTELENLISKRNGRVLLLNIWATWCIPCREEIPDLNKMHNKYSDKVEVAGISVDYPDEVTTRINPFIKDQKIKYKMYVNNMKDEALIDYFGVKWNGAVPATFIFDKKGKLVLFLEGKRSFKDFEKSVSGMLK